MNASTFTTVRTARTAIEADLLLSVLRAADLHPVDLAMSPHFSLAGAETSYPIQVPAGEADRAREVLDSHAGI